MEDNRKDYRKKENILTPLKAIKQHCFECVGENRRDVDGCMGYKCPLYPHRFGKDGSREPRKLTEDQRQVLRDRMKNIREGKKKDE